MLINVLINDVKVIIVFHEKGTFAPPLPPLAEGMRGAWPQRPLSGVPASVNLLVSYKKLVLRWLKI